MLAYKQSLDHDHANRPTLYQICTKPFSIPPNSHGACLLNGQHACLLVTHRRKDVPLLFRVPSAFAYHSDDDSESDGISLCCLKWHLFFSIIFLSGANILWDNILKFRLYYQNMLSFISNGSKKHMWSTCLLKLRTVAGNERGSYSASETVEFLCTLKIFSFWHREIRVSQKV